MSNFNLSNHSGEIVPVMQPEGMILLDQDPQL